MPSCMRLNIPAESPRREGRSRFIVDSTCGQALVPPSTVRFAPLMYDDSGPATNATSARDLVGVSIPIERNGRLLASGPLARGGVQVGVDGPRLDVVERDGGRP